jgi:hypothetical protein
MDLLQGDRMGDRAAYLNLDLAEFSGRAVMLSERSHRQRSGLIQTFGFDLDCMS